MQFSDMMDRVDSISTVIEHLFNVIDEKVTLILTDADEVINNVNELIGDVNREKVGSILDNVDLIVKTNAETIGGILENLRSMLSQVDALSGSLNRVVVDNEEQIQETFVLLNSLIESGEQTVGNLEELIGLSKDDIQRLVKNTTSVSQHFVEISAEIHKNKARIDTMLANLDTVRRILPCFCSLLMKIPGRMSARY